MNKPTISLVFPAWNEAENLRTLYREVRQVLLPLGVSHEMVFVDNGSTDESLSILKELAKEDEAVRYVSLSRNFGHQGALLAGLHYSRGDAVITMDADLQHPPSLIPQLVELWRQGFEVVYTTKRETRLPPLRRQEVRFFYWLMSKLSALHLSLGQSDFRLLDRKVVDVIVRLPEYRKFFRGLVEWVGFRQTGIEYDVAPRRAGRSKFSYRSLVSFAVDGILAFSFLPLRWSLVVGVTVAVLCFLYGVATVALGVLAMMGADYSLPPGWVTLSASALFLASVQLIAIGLLSEYVGRIFEQTKGRPPFIVRGTSEVEDRRE
jgi:dolichol-phosphate mannosyltransferase